jgi:hypothetical protein
MPTIWAAQYLAVLAWPYYLLIYITGRKKKPSQNQAQVNKTTTFLLKSF